MDNFINDLMGPLVFLLLRGMYSNPGALNLTILFFCCILYVLETVGVMRIAQQCKIKHSWLALVPVVGIYTTGRVALERKADAYLLLFANTIVPAFETLLNHWYPTDSKATVVLCRIGIRILSLWTSYKIYKKMSNRAIEQL